MSSVPRLELTIALRIANKPRMQVLLACEIEFLRKMVRKNSSLVAKYHLTIAEVVLISWYERAEEHCHGWRTSNHL